MNIKFKVLIVVSVAFILGALLNTFLLKDALASDCEQDMCHFNNGPTGHVMAYCIDHNSLPGGNDVFNCDADGNACNLEVFGE